MTKRLSIWGGLPVALGMAALAGSLTVTAPFAIRAADLLVVPVRFRLLVSETMIGADVNEGDASLAIQAWRNAFLKEVNFLIDTHVSEPAKALKEIREHQVDGFTLTSNEFFQVESYADPRLVLDEAAAGGDEYVLLVHGDSGLRSLADLRHKSVNVLDGPKMCLAGMWLETLAASAKLGKPLDFLGSMAKSNKLSSVVLPVYFRQVDACLVTRRGFTTMCELNPQIGRKLRAIATSPKLVTTVMAFHKDYTADSRQRCQTALTGLHKSVAGQQALTLFESSRLVMANVSALTSARELVKEYDHIHGKSGAVRR